MTADAAVLVEASGKTGPSLPPENLSGHTKKLRFLLEHLGRYLSVRSGSASLLDFGCGNGSAVSRFLMLPGVRYHGVDIHVPSLDHARAHFASESATFSSAVPEGVRFDVLVYADILEHVEDPAGVLRDHAARHADSGLLLGSVPNGFGPFENEKRLDRWLKISAFLDLPARARRTLGRVPPTDPAALPYNAESGHVQFFTRRSLFATLGAAGYRIVDFRNGAFVGAPLSERYLLKGERIARWNASLADRVPYWAASTWLFAAEKVS